MTKVLCKNKECTHAITSGDNDVALCMKHSISIVRFQKCADYRKKGEEEE